jgi:hypothetical protein
VLKVSELFGYGDIDELVERDTFFLREVFRNPAHRWHEPKRELGHGNLFLVGGHNFLAPLPEFTQQFNGSQKIHLKTVRRFSKMLCIIGDDCVRVPVDGYV